MNGKCDLFRFGLCFATLRKAFLEAAKLQHVAAVDFRSLS